MEHTWSGRETDMERTRSRAEREEEGGAYQLGVGTGRTWAGGHGIERTWSGHGPKFEQACSGSAAQRWAGAAGMRDGEKRTEYNKWGKNEKE